MSSSADTKSSADAGRELVGRMRARPHRGMTVPALSSALPSFPYKTAAVAAS
jgi:hypothetical protein